MSAKTKDRDKTAAEPVERPPGDRPLGRQLAKIALAVVIVGGLTVAIWGQVRQRVLSRGAYVVDPQQIAITPTPEWIRADVGDIRSEALLEASLNGPLSLLDPELAPRVAAAFTAHPWVAKVTRVTKQYPSTVEVAIEYRRPVAMVEVKGGVHPVDVEGVLLPAADFSQEEAASYPRIGAISSAAPVKPGTRWPDQAVAGGAQIAAALWDVWRELGLARVEPIGRAPAIGGGAEFLFTLTTRGGSRIRWGRAPSGDLPGELSVEAKIAQFQQWVADNGSLDGAGEPQQLEFDSGKLVRKPRPPVPALPVRAEH